MLYKVLFCVAVLLIGTPPEIQAQEVVPTVVEMQRDSTKPTTVRTGEPFTQVYKISYIRSKNPKRWGKEVLILEDQMRPLVFPAPLGDFEIIGWVLDEPVATEGEETDELTRYLRLTLRIIKPKKDAYEVPKFNVYWALKNGDKIENQDPIETEPVHVNYVTTATKDPYLDIRDNIESGGYFREANMFWWISRLGFLGIFISLFLLVASLRLVKHRKMERSKEKPTEEEGQECVVVSKPLSFNQAYRNFFKEAGRLSKERGLSDLTMERSLYTAVRNVLATRLGKIKPGDTAADIGLYIEKNVKAGVYKNTLFELQKALVFHRKNIESGVASMLTDSYLYKLKGLVRLLKRRWRIMAFLRKRKV
ncbi:MAG: hypothetical protein HYX22_02225 [Candidatus Yanofskybacteria bacterium]|nr:hypothetical protein [Candidatus Yanofskybacteria bacterium]